MKPGIATLRALALELRLAHTDWEKVHPMVSPALNWAPLKRLDKRVDGIERPPLEVFTGIVLACPAKLVLNMVRARLSTWHRIALRSSYEFTKCKLL